MAIEFCLNDFKEATNSIKLAETVVYGFCGSDYNYVHFNEYYTSKLII